jgi:hypothetical protein
MFLPFVIPRGLRHAFSAPDAWALAAARIGLSCRGHFPSSPQSSCGLSRFGPACAPLHAAGAVIWRRSARLAVVCADARPSRWASLVATGSHRAYSEV